MKITVYKCDRCGHESNIPTINLICMMGTPLHSIHKLPDIQTGDLCVDCESDWCNTFFNQIKAWIIKKS